MEKSLDFYQSVMEKSLNSEIDIDCIDQYIYAFYINIIYWHTIQEIK